MIQNQCTSSRLPVYDIRYRYNLVHAIYVIFVSRLYFYCMLYARTTLLPNLRSLIHDARHEI